MPLPHRGKNVGLAHGQVDFAVSRVLWCEAERPVLKPEWHTENRTCGLIAERHDAAIGGAFVLAPGFVSRTLAPLHVVAVAHVSGGRRQPILQDSLPTTAWSRIRCARDEVAIRCSGMRAARGGGSATRHGPAFAQDACFVDFVVNAFKDKRIGRRNLRHRSRLDVSHQLAQFDGNLSGIRRTIRS